MTESDIVRVTLPERHIEGRRLGRHVVHDVRSRNYEAETAAAIKSVQHTSVSLPLDQGAIGSCTANALCGALDSSPDHTSGRRFHERDAVKLYELETQLEGKPYPPNDPGGSGLMVCKAAKQLGWISSYRHTFSIHSALLALTLRPVITGVNWYTSFDEPDENGLVAIAPNATVRGGHEVLADGIDEPNQLVWFWNSWGKSFGVGGRFCMSFDTWAQLLAEQGDVTVPMV
jgi:C1A family cysteine protease